MLIAKKANAILSCINRSIEIVSWKIIVPLDSTLIRPHLEYYVCFWTFKKGSDKLQLVWKRATENMKVMETTPLRND